MTTAIFQHSAGRRAASLAAFVLLGGTALPSHASSHREAPLITSMPQVDGTDFYMFASYDPNRSKAPDGSNYVTMVANYTPLQDAYGGPNYFSLNPKAVYEIHVDNDGTGNENLTFQFRFTSVNTNFSINGVAIPLTATGPLCTTGCSTVPSYKADPALNAYQDYTLTLVQGSRTGGRSTMLSSNGNKALIKPADNIGTKTIPNYSQYASQYVYPIDPFTLSSGKTCSGGQVFVGQRTDPFFVNLGQTFDLINIQNGAPNIPATGNGVTSPYYSPSDPGNSATNFAYDSLAGKNITSLVIELPASCLTKGSDPVIGGWTTASMHPGPETNPIYSTPGWASNEYEVADGSNWLQVSRLGMPLVNEVVIGLQDKDKFNASEPKNDVKNFAPYVLYPTLPQLVNLLFGVPAPAGTVVSGLGAKPVREDLIATFLTGLKFTIPAGATIYYGGPVTLAQDTPFSNVPASGSNTTLAEMLRLNTAVPATPIANQQRLGLIALDAAGFPNGRRLIDDVVDIELRVAEGRLCHLNGILKSPNWACTDATAGTPATTIDFADGVAFKHIPGDNTTHAVLPTAFPYLALPMAGSPNQSGY